MPIIPAEAVRECSIGASEELSVMAIKQPHNTRGLTWDSTFGARYNGLMTRRQKFVDSQVLRVCEPLIPLQTRYLINSAKMGTIIGSGEIKYLAVYAAFQYYDTAESRPYDPNRGAHWFERMKVAHREAILRGAQQIE